MTDNCFLKLNAGLLFEFDIKNDIVKNIYYFDKVIKTDTTKEDLANIISQTFEVSREMVDKFVISWFLSGHSLENIISLDSKDEKKFFRLKKYCDENIVVGEMIYQKPNSGLYNLIDPLTEVYQKNSMEEFVKNEIESGNKEFALVIIDIDDFKDINDSYGHMFGDKILKEITKLFKNSLPNSIIGRIGGDEFMAMIYGINDYDNVWNQIYELYRKAKFYDGGVKNNISFAFSSSVYASMVQCLVSFTCGIARFPFDGTSYDELFKKADKALYRGKRKTKNCFIIYLDEKHKNIDTYILHKNKDISNVNNASIYKLFTKCFNTLDSKLSYLDNIKNFNKVIGEYFLADRASIYYTNGIDKLKKLSIWCNPKCSLANDENFSYELEDYHVWDEHFFNEEVGMAKVSSLKGYNDELYERLEKQNTKSLLLTYLKVQGNMLGILRIDTCLDYHTFTEDERKSFRVAAKLLSMYLYKMNEVEIFESAKKYDHKTGLPNYSYFCDFVNQIMTTNPISSFVAYSNIANIRHINEQYGYEVGARAYLEFTKILKKCFKEAKITRVNSYFIIFVLGLTNPVENIKELFNLCRYVSVGEHVLNLTILIGYYLTDGAENSIYYAVDNAKTAYLSIENRIESSYILFDKKMLEKINKETTIANDFRQAMMDNEIEVYFQPKVNLENGELIGAEALSRWIYKSKQMLYPDIFIPILEKYNLITELDIYVFSKVCQFISEMVKNNNILFPISINLSRKVTDFNYYYNSIESIRKKYNIDPTLLEIEITESMFVKDYEELNYMVNNLRKLGYKISIDDFGSGYSNLELLSKNSFDILKIDRALLNVKEAKNRLILKTVIDLAKNLQICIICEGVEDLDQIEFLRNSGCIYAQGYYYDKPIPQKTFIEKYLKVKD